MIIYVIILVAINIKNENGEQLTTVYMRILTNYFQILTLAQSYDLDWQDNVKEFLQSKRSYLINCSPLFHRQELGDHSFY